MRVFMHVNRIHYIYNVLTVTFTSTRVCECNTYMYLAALQDIVTSQRTMDIGMIVNQRRGTTQ
jgi:hypothetical protein